MAQRDPRNRERKKVRKGCRIAIWICMYVNLFSLLTVSRRIYVLSVVQQVVTVLVVRGRIAAGFSE